MAGRFPAAAAEQIGKISASLWMAGVQALHAQGIPVPANVQAALAPFAMQAVLGQISGAQFLVRIGSQLGSQQEFSRFLESLQAWYHREHGTARYGRPAETPQPPQQRPAGPQSMFDIADAERPAGMFGGEQVQVGELFGGEEAPVGQRTVVFKAPNFEGGDKKEAAAADDPEGWLDEEAEDETAPAQATEEPGGQNTMVFEAPRFGREPTDTDDLMEFVFGANPPNPAMQSSTQLGTRTAKRPTQQAKPQAPAPVPRQPTPAQGHPHVRPQTPAAQANPYAAPQANPYAAPQANPYAAPQANPYAAPQANPYASPPTTTPPPIPGDISNLSKVAGFEILELLGEGGMGRVYKAIQRSLDRHVALKVMTPALAMDESFSARLEQEAKAAAKLRHPNVVGVIEQGTCPHTGVKFVAFDYVDGEPASDLLEKQGRLYEADALTICLGIAEALSCAEGAGIVHRDIKPDNILIGSNGIPMLADLGLAKQTSEDGGTDTAVGLFMGTPHYAAPEQALGVDEVDIRADLYALGICLWQFLTGTLPFPATTPIAILTRHINEDVPDPRTLNSAISKTVTQLINALCARDRNHRYGTAREAADNIRRVLEGKPPVVPTGQAKGRVIAPKGRTSTGVRAGPQALPGDSGTPSIPELAEERGPAAGTKRFSGRGFYDDPNWQKEQELEGEVKKVERTEGSNYYDDGVLGQTWDGEQNPYDGIDLDDPYGDPAPMSADDIYGTPSDDGDPYGASAATEDDQLGDRLHAHGAGRGFYDDEVLLDTFRLDDGSGVGPEDDDAEEPTMLLADDGARAYQIRGKLGEGTQAAIYEATVMGDQELEGFRFPVEVVAIKVAKRGSSLRHEQALYATPDPRIVRMVDSGTLQGDNPYLVLERLQQHPGERFPTKSGRSRRLDPGTAVETFVNLLEALKGIQFRRTNPLVLCNIKPGNIMFRMPSSSGHLETIEYLERLSKGHYEPVFTDLNAAQDRLKLRERKGKLDADGRLGDPLYLPPESVPTLKGRDVVPGIYTTKTDVYSLCLTFYALLTGDSPYSQHDLDKLQGSDYLRQILFLKRKGRSPIQRELIEEYATGATDGILDILQAGLLKDPARRATPQTLLLKCKKVFGLVEAHPKERDQVYHFDDPENGVRLRQREFARLNPMNNLYLRDDEEEEPEGEGVVEGEPPAEGDPAPPG